MGDRAQRAGGFGLSLVDGTSSVLSKPGVVGACICIELAFDERYVYSFLDELVPIVHERLFCAGILGKDHDTGSVAVEPMHERGPTVGVAALDMGAHKVVRSFFPGTRACNNCKACWFFYGNKISVFVEELDPARVVLRALMVRGTMLCCLTL